MNILYARRRKWPVILAIVIGLGVSGFAGTKLYQEVDRIQQTMTVVVPTSDIDPYSKLTLEDVTTAQIAATVVDANTVTKLADVKDKMTVAPLYKGKPIDKRVLAETADDIGSYQVVGVNIDPARNAGVKKGDIVDVYWLRPEQGAWMPSQASILVARDVRVLRVCDERGQALDDEKGVVQSAVGGVNPVPRKPAIVYLLVKPQDVPNVIGGAGEKSSFIALAKKSKPGSTEQEVTTASASAGMAQTQTNTGQ